MTELYRVNAAGEYIYADPHSRYVRAEACTPCCGIVINNCTEWDAICTGDAPFDLNVEADGAWFEAGTSSCDCTLIPESSIIETVCESLFNVMRGEGPYTTVCPFSPDVYGRHWALVACESGMVTVIIRQCSSLTSGINHVTGVVSASTDLWQGYHEWSTTFAPPLTIGAPITVPWSHRVEDMAPSGLFVPVGCRPTNSTQPDATLVISPG